MHMYMYVCVTKSDEVGVTGNHPHFARLSNELDVVFQESFFTFLVLHEQNRTHWVKVVGNNCKVGMACILYAQSADEDQTLLYYY